MTFDPTDTWSRPTSHPDSVCPTPRCIADIDHRGGHVFADYYFDGTPTEDQ